MLITLFHIHLDLKYQKFNFNEEVFDNSSTAIIIQGPIYGLKNFVKETLMFYTKIFENVPIILYLGR